MSARKRQAEDEDGVSGEHQVKKHKLTHLAEFKRSDYTIGWVCALPEELIAAKAILDQIHQDLSIPSTDDNVYTLGSVGKHMVVIACLPMGKYGTTSAAVVATQMIDSFPSIRFGFMIGIGGGIPSKAHDIRLGDVVVSTPSGPFPGVVQWDFGKAREGGNFERIGALNNPPRAVLTALSKLKTEHEMNGSKMPQYLKELEEKWPNLASYARSDSLKDILFAADNPHRDVEVGNDDTDDEEEEEEDNCRLCDTTKVKKRKARHTMKIHYGLIASGHQVIKDAVFRDKLKRDLGGHVLCVEMEAAGLMDTFPCIVIRGICDYADSHKNNDWQKHAAAVAVAYAKELLSILPSHDVEQMATIKDIDNKLDQISSDVKTFRQSNEQQAVLEWLSPINYALQQHDFINRRHPGTGQWLLESEEFQKFLTCRGQILFCDGYPGAGKTMLSSIVVDHLQQHGQKLSTSDSRTKTENVGLAYVYCDFGKRNEQKPVDVLANLIKQLVQDRPSIPDALTKLYEKEKHIGPSVRSRSDIKRFTEVLQHVISETYDRVFIVIDALDECPHVQTLLPEIFEVLGATQANLFTASRPQPEIQCLFNGSLYLNIQAKDEDVKRYIDGRMFEFKVLRDDNMDLNEEVKRQLKTNITVKVSDAVDGIFLLARFHIDSLLGKTTPKKIRDTLQTLPKGPDAYEQAYGKTIRRISSQQSELRRLAKRVLEWLACAERPLTSLELRHALAVTLGCLSLPSEDDLESTTVIVDVCMGLVRVEEASGGIRLLHHTTLEYLHANMGCLMILEDPSRLTNLQDATMTGPRETEAAIARAQQNITMAVVTYISVIVLDDETNEHQYPLLEYTVTNWGHHARKASIKPNNSIEMENSILEFLESDTTKVSHVAKAMLISPFGYKGDGQSKTHGLHLAAYFGLSDITAALLKKGHDPNIENGGGKSALFYAVGSRHYEVTYLLLQAGANPNKQRADGKTPLFIATEHRDKTLVGMLLEAGANPDHDTRHEFMPLSVAVDCNDEEIVDMLLKAGANPNYEDKTECTPLLRALLQHNNVIIRMLLLAGANPNYEGRRGVTLLYLAVDSAINTDETAIVELMLKYCADPNCIQVLEGRGIGLHRFDPLKDGYFKTPYYKAVLAGKKQLAEVLQRHGGGLSGEQRDSAHAQRSRSPSVINLSVENRNVIWLQSCDDAIVKVERNVVEKSALIKNLLEITGDESVVSQEPILIPHIKQFALEVIFQWCGHSCKDSGLSNDDMKDWEEKYFQVDWNVLIELILAAKYLAIEDLPNLLYPALLKSLDSKHSKGGEDFEGGDSS